MKVKNNSTRLHHVGLVAIAPGCTEEVDDAYAGALNPDELEEVEGGAEEATAEGTATQRSAPTAAAKGGGKGKAAAAQAPAPAAAPPAAPEAPAAPDLTVTPPTWNPPAQ